MATKPAKEAKKPKPAAKVKDIQPQADASGGAQKPGHGRRRFKIRFTGG